MKPYVVYFYPYNDIRLFEKQKSPQKHVCCVNAENVEHAIKKTTSIAMAHGCNYLKIMGIANGKPEWVNENSPL